MINDNTAVALGWGIWKNKKGQFGVTPKEGAPADHHVGPCTVMFVDFGACQMTTSVVKFNENKMQTLTTTHDKM
jgi:hypothetical protein